MSDKPPSPMPNRSILLCLTLITCWSIAHPLSAQTDPAIWTKNPAVARFKKEMDVVDIYIREERTSAKSDATGGVVWGRNVARRLRTVDVSQLPPDLKAAYSGMVTILAREIEVFKGWPEKRLDVSNYAVRMSNTKAEWFHPTYLAVNAIRKDVLPYVFQLEELSKKYGFIAPDITWDTDQKVVAEARALYLVSREAGSQASTPPARSALLPRAAPAAAQSPARCRGRARSTRL